jgi:hypothetical protein
MKTVLVRIKLWHARRGISSSAFQTLSEVDHILGIAL